MISVEWMVNIAKDGCREKPTLGEIWLKNGPTNPNTNSMSSCISQSKYSKI
jgi:hypothetical protein